MKLHEEDVQGVGEWEEEQDLVQEKDEKDEKVHDLVLKDEEEQDLVQEKAEKDEKDMEEHDLVLKKGEEEQDLAQEEGKDSTIDQVEKQDKSSKKSENNQKRTFGETIESQVSFTKYFIQITLFEKK